MFINMVVQLVCASTGVDFESIKSGSREQGVADSRRMICALCRKHGASLKKIAVALEMKERGVESAINTHKAMMESVDPRHDLYRYEFRKLEAAVKRETSSDTSSEGEPDKAELPAEILPKIRISNNGGTA